MLTRDFADRFTKEWIAAWNAHDIDRVLSHYTDDFEMSSPFIAGLGLAPSGTLRGKPAVAAYWRKALEQYPDLSFLRLGIHVGVDSVVLRYRSVLNLIACETFFFTPGGKVSKAVAHYNHPDPAEAAEQNTWFFGADITPIINVSDVAASIAWFEKLGWRKCFSWTPTGNPAEEPTFGGVGAGQCEIFLCHDAQGSRGKGPNHSTSGGPGQDDTMDKGSWMSVWVADVDAIHARCLQQGLDVTHPPTDEPWGVREMHVRHPDGHVLRISRGES